MVVKLKDKQNINMKATLFVVSYYGEVTKFQLN